MNFTEATMALPPLPKYTLAPQPDLLPPIPDKVLTMILPIVAYWAVSMFFHWIDVNDYFAKYRLHTPAEILKRNHASRYDVARDVILQQFIQTIIGLLLGATEGPDMIGKEAYDEMVWAQRIRVAQHAVPTLLAIFSIDSHGLAKNLAAYPAVAGLLNGGGYHSPNTTVIETMLEAPGFAVWEISLAKLIYWFVIPALQYTLAMCTMDSWQYFLHRAMHMNKWLYTTFHSRHHRLYVPYAFGALYNHPFEGFLLDSLGGAISYKVAGLNTRQGMWFFTCSTIKTVDDHCGYALPFDPLQRLTSNNAGYHDVHHQSWGIKTNFSQPFFTFWDKILGTMWTGGDVSARYARAAKAAQAKVDADAAVANPVTGSDPSLSRTQDLRPYTENEGAKMQGVSTDFQEPAAPAGKAALQAAASREQVVDDAGTDILIEEAKEEQEEQEQEAKERSTPRKGHRRRTASSLNSDGLRGLRERVSIHGRTGGIIGVDHAH